MLPGLLRVRRIGSMSLANFQTKRLKLSQRSRIFGFSQRRFIFGPYATDDRSKAVFLSFETDVCGCLGPVAEC
jgi:hypothetical protein